MTTATVTWIDKINPTAQINYSTEALTNKDVIVTLVNASEEITITNNNGNNSYTFTDNGTFTFEFVDKAGNTGTAIAEVTWIDKTAPTAEIVYNITTQTSEPVTATLTNESEEIVVTNNNGSRTYTFTENGDFTFEFVDKVGNKGTVIASVNWIGGEQPNPDNPEETIKKGDIDGNGKLGPTDLSKIKLYLIDKEELSEKQQKAADINGDGRITATDLSQLKLALIGLLEI